LLAEMIMAVNRTAYSSVSRGFHHGSPGALLAADTAAAT
jgi:hypothetical protein